MGFYYQKSSEKLNDDAEFPVTKADKAVHELLIEGLTEITPDIPVVSEENDSNHKTKAKVYWLVDPIDGTKGFIDRNDHFTINVGLIVDGYPEFGVLYAPALREMFWGGKDYGSFKKDGFKPQTSLTAKSSRRDVVAIIRDKPDDRTYELLQKVGVKEKIRLEASLKFGRIAEGTAQIYVRYTPQHWWDVAAGQAIAEGAGSAMINPDTNKRFKYDLSGGTLITPLVCHSLGGLIDKILNPPPPKEDEKK